MMNHEFQIFNTHYQGFFLLLILCNLGNIQFLLAQNEKQSVLEIRKGNRLKTVHNGKKVIIRYQDSLYSGIIDNIVYDSIQIGNKIFDVNEIDKIRTWYRTAILFGANKIWIGLSTGFVSTMMLYTVFSEGTYIYRYNIPPILICSITECLDVIVIMNGIRVATAGNNYIKKRGWKFNTVEQNQDSLNFIQNVKK
jgi:hypothetical protein